MKFIQIDPQGIAKTLYEVRVGFIAKFQNPNLEQQSCTELKNIKYIVDESAWEYNW
jgi:hypothetical protein